MKLLVTGGRDYNKLKEVYGVLDDYLFDYGEELKVIQGGATGADALARRWCEDRGVPCETYTADWKKYGKSAGALRNIEMLREGQPDIVVAFPGGSGTEHCVKTALAWGFKVHFADKVM